MTNRRNEEINSAALQLPACGFVRLSKLFGPGNPIPASRSTAYAWIKAGLFPAPVPIGPGRIKGFRVEDVRAFLAKPGPQQPATTVSRMTKAPAS